MAHGHTLILGGARSGKSALSERVALTLSDCPAYVATSEAHDAEMEARIARHRTDRDTRFETYEEPLDLTGVLGRTFARHQVVLVDCLTLWISNLMAAERNVDEAVAGLSAFLDTHRQASIILVSNEVGLGIVPDNPMARTFRDHAGRTHQQLGEMCDTVAFVAAGLPMTLKGRLPD